MKFCTPEDIDRLLPQTQCGLCGYGGCMPYAEAILFEKAPLNLCPPGGVKTLKALGILMQQDITPFIAEMEQKTKPPMLAVIREAECIGCTKCIKACPVDAILGSAKEMHTVITDECTGCELCIPPCPVDCIDMLTATSNETNKEKWRQRFNAHEERLAKKVKEKKLSKLDHSLSQRKAYIQEALARVKIKKTKGSL